MFVVLELQPDPQAEDATDSTVVAVMVLRVCVPLHDVPSVAAEQVYERSPFEIDGPPDGAKFVVAAIVIVMLLPLELFRMR